MGRAFAILSACVLLLFAGGCNARVPSAPALPEGGSAQALGAWWSYCLRNLSDSDCGKPRLYTSVIIDVDYWKFAELQRVNAEINALPYASDPVVHAGVVDYWVDIRQVGRGDCEDYAIAKRNALIARGWPRSALKLAFVIDYDAPDPTVNGGHAVLTVDAKHGTLVLDNRFSDVLAWNDPLLGKYHWISRQDGSGARWVRLSSYGELYHR